MFLSIPFHNGVVNFRQILDIRSQIDRVFTVCDVTHFQNQTFVIISFFSKDPSALKIEKMIFIDRMLS